jgi:hypothetical protein
MFNRSLRRAFVFGLLLSCAACATPYQARDRDGFGYSFQQVGAGEYLVDFTANTATDSERMQDFALLRAAQMAALLGYAGVAVLDTSSEDAYLPTTTGTVHANGEPSLVSTPGILYTAQGVANNHGQTVTLHVRFLAHAADAGGKRYEDARATIKRLSAKYSLQLATTVPATGPHN